MREKEKNTHTHTLNGIPRAIPMDKREGRFEGKERREGNRQIS